MSKVSDIQRDIATKLFFMFPPRVRERLARSVDFRTRYGLEAKSSLTLGNSDVSFQQSEFYQAVRALYAGNRVPIEAITMDSRKAKLSLQEGDRKQYICITLDSQTHLIPSLWFLSADRDFRLEQFDHEISDRNLFGDAIALWRRRLDSAPLSDDDIDDFHNVLQTSVAGVADAIATAIRKPECDVSILVPRSLGYYEYLIGQLGGATSVESYIEEQFPQLIDRLLRWDFSRGLAQCLHVCAHPLMASRIDISGQDAGAVENFFHRLESYGDRFSQMAGFEVGIRVIDRFPALEPILLRIATVLLDEDSVAPGGRLTLTSGLVIFVDGELSRTGLFRNKPPFWRRLAAIAQASIIEREMIGAGVSCENSAEWATQGREEQFYMQTFADLRLEPRWLPDLMNARQLRFEFLSRIHIAADHVKDRIPPGELYKISFEDGPGGVRASMRSPFAFLPGPLEGASVAQPPFPDEALMELRKPKDGTVLQAQDFASVVNLALVFRLEPEVAQLIAQRLRTFNYRVSLGDDSGVTFSLVAGLALVAAVTRMPELSDEVRVLSRVLRRRGDLSNDPLSQMQIALIACASREDLESWCKSVGDWLVELAYDEIDTKTARALRSHLRKLCQIVPPLWVWAAKADAALAAVVGYRT